MQIYPQSTTFNSLTDCNLQSVDLILSVYITWPGVRAPVHRRVQQIEGLLTHRPCIIITDYFQLRCLLRHSLSVVVVVDSEFPHLMPLDT
jgi:hypothetical protein